MRSELKTPELYQQVNEAGKAWWWQMVRAAEETVNPNMGQLARNFILRRVESEGDASQGTSLIDLRGILERIRIGFGVTRA